MVILTALENLHSIRQAQRVEANGGVFSDADFAFLGQFEKGLSRYIDRLGQAQPQTVIIGLAGNEQGQYRSDAGEPAMWRQDPSG